jgi:hypothetical protein
MSTWSAKGVRSADPPAARLVSLPAIAARLVSLPAIVSYRCALMCTDVVFKDVLSSEEVDTAIEKLWKEIETRSDAVVRSDPSTWDNGWRTNGWGHDDFLWYVRGCPNVRKVWEQLHDTDDVIVSFDGANIQKPWGLNPKWRGGAGTMHTDRRNHEGVPDGYIQGFVNLRPTSPETGGNYVVPRSHHFYHELEEWRRSLPQEERGNFYALVAKERPELFQEVINAHLEPGDVFLWTDMTLHQACPGKGVGPTEPELTRAAVYVCMSPKSKATAEVLEERRKAVYHNTGNGHTAHHPMGSPGRPKVWEEPKTPFPLKRLTEAQRKLVG